MSVYQCQKCGCVENTALGFYHSNNMTSWWSEEYIDKELCSACGPATFLDGTPSKRFGKWHGKFERKFYPLGSLYTDDQGNLRRKSDNKYHWEEERT